MINPRITKKELGLIKGALRRVFSRSDLRKKVLYSSQIMHYDKERPRVTKWGKCNECQKPVALYQVEIDHTNPLIPVNESLESLITKYGWDTLINALWCEETNLAPLCQICHRLKSTRESKQRREHRKNGKSITSKTAPKPSKNRRKRGSSRSAD